MCIMKVVFRHNVFMWKKPRQDLVNSPFSLLPYLPWGYHGLRNARTPETSASEFTSPVTSLLITNVPTARSEEFRGVPLRNLLFALHRETVENRHETGAAIRGLGWG